MVATWSCFDLRCLVIDLIFLQSCTNFLHIHVNRPQGRSLCLNVCSLRFFTVYDDYKFVTKQDLESLGTVKL